MFLTLCSASLFRRGSRCRKRKRFLYVYGNAGTLYIDHTVSVYQTSFHVYEVFVLKLLGDEKREDEEEAVTEEEVKALLKMGNESGTFDDDEKEMIDSVFKFDRRTAREIMVPRREVIAFDIDDPFEEMIDEILETRHNRIPVYEENIDNIIGVLHVKDMMIEMRKHPLKKGDVRQMLRQPFFIPETKEADELFRIMQETRHHMALFGR